MSPLIAVFSGITVLAAVLAVVFSDMRKVIVASWIASMSAGALFLSYGAEYLAVVQWLVGTLVAISFLVYASLFGGYTSLDARPKREKVFDAIPALVIGLSFFAIVTVAVLGQGANLESPAADLVATGQSLSEKHVISLELMAFLLLAVLVGAGVVGRAEESESEASS